ncbi:MAG: hypothetical protein M3P85_13940 [Actinomycetota bacterium]|nr:hypothetical protein [Actinomycetota bacterium]
MIALATADAGPARHAVEDGEGTADVRGDLRGLGPGEKTFWNFYRDFKEYEPAGSQEAHPLEETRADATHRLPRRIYDMNEEQLDAKTREYIKKAVS